MLRFEKFLRKLAATVCLQIPIFVDYREKIIFDRQDFIKVIHFLKSFISREAE